MTASQGNFVQDFLGGYAQVYARWAARIEATESPEELRPVYRAMLGEIAQFLAEIVALDVAGWPRHGPAGALVEQHIERQGEIFGAVVVETGQSIGLDTPGWLADAAAEAVAAYRARIDELRVADVGGRG